MPEIHIRGTEVGGDMSRFHVNSCRVRIIDLLAPALHAQMPDILFDAIELSVELTGIVVYTHNLCRDSSINSFPVEVRVEPGALSASKRRALANSIDEFVNGEWLPTVDEALVTAAKLTKIEIIVGSYSSAGVTYDPHSGKRLTWD